MIPNCAESIRKLIKKLGPAHKLRACYEAGRRAPWCTANWRSWSSALCLQETGKAATTTRKNSTVFAVLTRSLHIRPKHSPSFARRRGFVPPIEFAFALGAYELRIIGNPDPPVS